MKLQTTWKQSDKIFCVAERGSCFKQKKKNRGHLSGKSRWCGSRKAWVPEKEKIKMVSHIPGSPPELRGWAILFNPCMRQRRMAPGHWNALWKQRWQAECTQVDLLHILLVSHLSKPYAAISTRLPSTLNAAVNRYSEGIEISVNQRCWSLSACLISLPMGNLALI